MQAFFNKIIKLITTTVCFKTPVTVEWVNLNALKALFQMKTQPQ